ncbi:MAG: PLP-dependent aminotransferase family protein [Pirellulaceae bacterium]|nr:PLP-dependent aminotransferase family protein [Planctomycetales bacterium]MCA9163409.1 PLP-dependent aminotransferase family protein [Planctomycetales bacterium]
MSVLSSELVLSQRSLWAEGQPISDLMSRALTNPDLISLAAGFVDPTSLPVEVTRDVLHDLLASDSEARRILQYGTTAGDPLLREYLLEELVERDLDGQRGDLSAEQVVLTAGSNQLLHLICETLLNPGDIVLCASPTYFVFTGMLTNIGARSIGVAVDDDGIIPESLEEHFEHLRRVGELDRIAAIYVVPYFDNPRGVTMSLERRARVVEIANRWSSRRKIHVISDDAYRELRYAGEDIPSMKAVDETGDTVIVTGTFSKSYAPGVRVGWGVLPRGLVEPICNQKGNVDFGSPHLNQHLMRRVLEMGVYRAHIEQVRASYRRKLEAMLAAADEFLSPLAGVDWRRPNGGLYVWAELPESIDTGPAGRLFDVAIQRGMFYVPGQYAFPAEGEPVRRNTMRLSFGVQTPDNIREGIRLLAEAIRDVM